MGSGRGRSEGAELEGENKRGGGVEGLKLCVRVMGGCVGSAVRNSFLPQMALAYRLDAISQGPKNSRIPGPNPLPLALVMDMHASKTLCTGLYKS